MNPELQNLQALPNFCILPWVHARLNQDGNVYTCCRMEELLPYGSLRTQSMPEIWNSKSARELRQAMLRGDMIEACRDCRETEQAGVTSYRQENNAEFAYLFERALRTKADGSVDAEPNFAFLDIRFSKTCNLRCRSCGPAYSTAWFHDAASLGDDRQNSQEQAFSSFADMWSVIEGSLSTLKVLYFAGGEPLLEIMHYQLLERLIEIGRTDIELRYNSNFSVLSMGRFKAVDLWNKFSSVILGASLDGVGEQAELLRKGLIWSEVQTRIHQLKQLAPHVKLQIYCTVTAINAFHITKALRYFLEHEFISSANDLILNPTHSPSYLSVAIYNEGERQQLASAYQNFLQNLRDENHSDWAKNWESQLQRVLLCLRGQSKQEDRSRFRKLSFALDHLRNERTILLFPELAELLFI